MSTIPQARKIGVRPFQRPAFLSLEKLGNAPDLALVATSFGPLAPGQVRAIPHVAQQLPRFAQARLETLTDDLRWPNQAEAVDADLLGRTGLLVSDGFLVPGKATGSVSFLEPGQAPLPLTSPKQGWFYHRAVPCDMNGDGRMDLVTARARIPLGGKPQGELIWLENPGPDATGPWSEHKIASGPDVHFRLADLDHDGRPEILATEFWPRKLSVHWLEEGRWQSRVVDDKLGSAFDLDVVDLNGDGRQDLLATNHEARDGAVYAYEIPENFKTAPWARHTLVSGLKSTLPGRHQAAPGQAVAFHPGPDHSGKPWIAVAGDASGRAHLLIPESNQPGDWRYQEKTLAEPGGTVGQLAVGDVNGDGWSEVFVPAYDKDLILAYTFAPSPLEKGSLKS